MVLEIVNFGHPALRQKGERVSEVTAEIRQFVADMIETMHAAEGVGLAAQQVARALQITVLDVRGVKDRPSTLEIDGAAVDVDAHMPLALINPEVTLRGGEVVGPEGCLSFPEIYADIPRTESVEVVALNDVGKVIRFTCGGLLARAIQHEHDHLRGILFIDRMTRAKKDELKPELDALQAETKAALKKQVR